MEKIDGTRLLESPGVGHFKTGSTFGALSNEAVAFLLSKGRVFSLSDGDKVFYANEPASCFYVVLEGSVNYFHDLKDTEVLIRTANFGDTVGYVSMIGLFDRIGIAKSRGSSLVLEISSDLFYQMHIDYPFDFGIVMLNLTRNMARTIRAVTTQYATACVGHPIP
ncbi:Crp/Fnr family transcriptional regulator [Zoogloea sp.]|uniref:Crp/Fnr family transcriptional regulator n=1 Tax=Zoogloea sp. TaxID=49181 RepID=UPI001415AAA3|nr:MAG: Crp/Fnr family transcriptional regulator [Zoogloea sp.]